MSSSSAWAPPANFGQQRLGVRGKSQRGLYPLNRFPRAQSQAPTRGGETFIVANDEKCDCGRGLADQLRKNRQGQQAGRSASLQSQKSRFGNVRQSSDLKSLTPQKSWRTVKREFEGLNKKSTQSLSKSRRSSTPSKRSVKQTRSPIEWKFPAVQTALSKLRRSGSTSKSKRCDDLPSECSNKEVCNPCREQKRKSKKDSYKPLASKLSSCSPNNHPSIKVVKSAPSLKRAKKSADDGLVCISCRERKAKKSKSASKKSVRLSRIHSLVKTSSQAKSIDASSRELHRRDKSKKPKCLIHADEQKDRRDESVKRAGKVCSRDSSHYSTSCRSDD